ncbi:MAG: hypothetical protein HY704_10075 [Gemmatimonadetes bacterium]|nr:hypothetical protein [Gemmatimonadota bacterium]
MTRRVAPALAAASDVLRRLSLSGRGSGIEARETARAAQHGVPTAMAWAPLTGALWFMSRDRLIAREPGELRGLSVVLAGGLASGERR